MVSSISSCAIQVLGEKKKTIIQESRTVLIDVAVGVEWSGWDG